MKKNNLVLIIFLLVMSFTTKVLSANLAGGTYTVGTGGNYANLTAVASILNSSTLTGNIIFELTSNYDGTTGETYPIIFNQFVTSGGNWTVTIRPAAGVSTRTTSGDPGSFNSLIEFNGADRIDFDGRAGGAGTTIGWIIRNTRSASSIGPVFNFINDACYNTLIYMQVEGQNTATNIGLIRIGTTTGTTGNDHNLFSFCTISSRTDVYAAAATGIYSMGTAGVLNHFNRVMQCNLAHFTRYGIYAGDTGNGDNWVISNNSFYYDRFAYGYSTLTQVAIYFFPGASSSGNSINNNYIGGEGPENWGWWSCQNNGFYGIKVNVGSGSITQINNNSFGVVKLNSTGSIVNFCGIELIEGLCEIKSNLIGGVNHYIEIQGDGTFWGITSGGSTNISQNEISHIRRTGPDDPVFFCIYLNGPYSQTLTRNNIFKINTSSDYISLAAEVTGIYINGDADDSPTYTLVNNRISLGNQTTGEFDADKSNYTGIYGNIWLGNTILSYYNSVEIYGKVLDESDGNENPDSYAYRTSGMGEPNTSEQYLL